MGRVLKDTNAKDAKKDRSKSEDDKLDDALDETFPASDAPSMTDPAEHLGSSRKTEKGAHKPQQRGRE